MEPSTLGGLKTTQNLQKTAESYPFTAAVLLTRILAQKLPIGLELGAMNLGRQARRPKRKPRCLLQETDHSRIEKCVGWPRRINTLGESPSPRCAGFGNSREKPTSGSTELP